MPSKKLSTIKFMPERRIFNGVPGKRKKRAENNSMKTIQADFRK